MPSGTVAGTAVVNRLVGHLVEPSALAGRDVMGMDHAGEVVGRSASMMTSYHNLSEKTREAEWFSPDGQRFIRTGDIGRFDADGFLMLVDRRKDMIISGGFNIYPSDIEAVLAQHPAVEESAFFGVPNERWGETPVAAVAPRFGAASTAEDILAFANGRLGKTQPPRGSVPSCVAAAQRDWQILKRDLRLTYPSKGGDSRHDDYRDR